MNYEIYEIELPDTNHRVMQLKLAKNTFNDIVKKALLEVVQMKHYWNNLFRNQSPGLIVDIGANVGLYTVSFSKVFPHSKVVGFEPVPDNFRKALINIELNNLSNVTLHERGIGSKEEERKLYLPNRPEKINCGLYTTVKPRRSLEEVTAKFARLDEGLLDSPASIVKIDVEGSENEIILAHSEYFAKCKMLHIEKNPNYQMGNNLDKLLQQLGFRHTRSFKYNMIWVNEDE